MLECTIRNEKNTFLIILNYEKKKEKKKELIELVVHVVVLLIVGVYATIKKQRNI
jgi:predicted nucleic acid-binding Zn ribbon protein